MVLVERCTRQLYGANGLAIRDGKGLACILLRVLNAILNGNIREDLMTSTIVSVPKKGDLRDMNNYRGLYQFNACVCEDCGGSDSSSYQL